MEKAALASDVIRFGIVMPTWNQGDFIEASIQSILDQAGNFTIDFIVMDGKSTDSTVTKLKKIEEFLCSRKLQSRCLDFHFSWRSEKDFGQSDAINKGFQKVSGDVLCWLNSDDRICPGALATVAKEFCGNLDLDMIVGSARAVDENNKELWIQKPQLPSIKSLLIERECPPQPSIFWRATAAAEIGPLDTSLRYTMDFDYWIRFVLNGSKIKVLNQVLSEQTYHSNCKSLEGGVLFQSFEPERKSLAERYALSASFQIDFLNYRKAAIQALKHLKHRLLGFLSQSGKFGVRFILTKHFFAGVKMLIKDTKIGGRLIQALKDR